MTYQGVVQNGAVVLHDGATLPEGTLVSVVLVTPAVPEVATSDDPPTVWQKLAELGRWAETQEKGAESENRLRALIQEGVDSPGIPADQAAARLRQFAQKLVQGK